MPHRILIADDHDTLRTTLRALLEGRADWQVCGEATNGMEAVQKAAELRPDVVILDLAMPEMDGLQAARKISLASPGMPILIFTNCVFAPETKLEARKCGVLEVVHKGAAGGQLLGAVDRLLNQKIRAAAEVELPKTADEPGQPPVNLKATDQAD